MIEHGVLEVVEARDPILSDEDAQGSKGAHRSHYHLWPKCFIFSDVLVVLGSSYGVDGIM